MRFVLLLVFFMSFMTAAPATVVERYPFAEPQQEQQFKHLLNELRCLVCQNQNLADSQSPLAEDLRQQVYQKVKKGENDQQIIYYLTARYGQFVLYRPSLNIQTYLLWVTPIILLCAGLLLMLFLIRRTRSH